MQVHLWSGVHQYKPIVWIWPSKKSWFQEEYETQLLSSLSKMAAMIERKVFQSGTSIQIPLTYPTFIQSNVANFYSRPGKVIGVNGPQSNTTSTSSTEVVYTSRAVGQTAQGKSLCQCIDIFESDYGPIYVNDR